MWGATLVLELRRNVMSYRLEKLFGASVATSDGEMYSHYQLPGYWQ